MQTAPDCLYGQRLAVGQMTGEDFVATRLSDGKVRLTIWDPRIARARDVVGTRSELERYEPRRTAQVLALFEEPECELVLAE